MRAADLIGQLADPLNLRRVNALYAEFLETGMADRCGLATPADMIEKYPAFFLESVEPYIGDTLGILELTIEGKQWIANLSSPRLHRRARKEAAGAACGGDEQEVKNLRPTADMACGAGRSCCIDKSPEIAPSQG